MLDVLSPPPAWIAPAPQTLIELQLPINKLIIVCHMLGGDAERRYYELYGCSLWARGGCLIVIPKIEGVVTERDQIAIRAHEIAHCNGWPAGHPFVLPQQK